MPRTKTRILMNPYRLRPEDHWASKAFRARVQRLSYARAKKRLADEAAAQQNAPDPATGGVDRESLPARPFARPSGVTILED